MTDGTTAAGDGPRCRARRRSGAAGDGRQRGRNLTLWPLLGASVSRVTHTHLRHSPMSPQACGSTAWGIPWARPDHSVVSTNRPPSSAVPPPGSSNSCSTELMDPS